jgi:hypothetical protein
VNATDIKLSLNDIQVALRYVDHIGGHIGEREIIRNSLIAIRERLLWAKIETKETQ